MNEEFHVIAMVSVEAVDSQPRDVTSAVFYAGNQGTCFFDICATGISSHHVLTKHTRVEIASNTFTLTNLQSTANERRLADLTLQLPPNFNPLWLLRMVKGFIGPRRLTCCHLDQATIIHRRLYSVRQLNQIDDAPYYQRVSWHLSPRITAETVLISDEVRNFATFFTVDDFKIFRDFVTKFSTSADANCPNSQSKWLHDDPVLTYNFNFSNDADILYAVNRMSSGAFSEKRVAPFFEAPYAEPRFFNDNNTVILDEGTYPLGLQLGDDKLAQLIAFRNRMFEMPLPKSLTNDVGTNYGPADALWCFVIRKLQSNQKRKNAFKLEPVTLLVPQGAFDQASKVQVFVAQADFIERQRPPDPIVVALTEAETVNIDRFQMRWVRLVEIMINDGEISLTTKQRVYWGLAVMRAPVEILIDLGATSPSQQPILTPPSHCDSPPSPSVPASKIRKTTTGEQNDDDFISTTSSAPTAWRNIPAIIQEVPNNSLLQAIAMFSIEAIDWQPEENASLTALVDQEGNRFFDICSCSFGRVRYTLSTNTRLEIEGNKFKIVDVDPKKQQVIFCRTLQMPSPLEPLWLLRMVKGYFGPRFSQCCRLDLVENIHRRLVSISQLNQIDDLHYYQRVSWENLPRFRKVTSNEVKNHAMSLKSSDEKDITDFIFRHQTLADPNCRNKMSKWQHDDSNVALMLSISNDQEILHAIEQLASGAFAAERLAPFFESPFAEPHPFRSRLAIRTIGYVHQDVKGLDLEDLDQISLLRDKFFRQPQKMLTSFDSNCGPVEALWCFLILNNYSSSLDLERGVILFPREAFNRAGKIQVFIGQGHFQLTMPEIFAVALTEADTISISSGLQMRWLRLARMQLKDGQISLKKRPGCLYWGVVVKQMKKTRCVSQGSSFLVSQAASAAPLERVLEPRTDLPTARELEWDWTMLSPSIGHLCEPNSAIPPSDIPSTSKRSDEGLSQLRSDASAGSKLCSSLRRSVCIAGGIGSIMTFKENKITQSTERLQPFLFGDDAGGRYLSLLPAKHRQPQSFAEVASNRYSYLVTPGSRVTSSGEIIVFKDVLLAADQRQKSVRSVTLRLFKISQAQRLLRMMKGFIGGRHPGAEMGQPLSDNDKDKRRLGGEMTHHNNKEAAAFYQRETFLSASDFKEPQKQKPDTDVGLCPPFDLLVRVMAVCTSHGDNQSLYHNLPCAVQMFSDINDDDILYNVKQALKSTISSPDESAFFWSSLQSFYFEQPFNAPHPYRKGYVAQAQEWQLGATPVVEETVIKAVRNLRQEMTHGYPPQLTLKWAPILNNVQLQWCFLTSADKVILPCLAFMPRWLLIQRNIATFTTQFLISSIEKLQNGNMCRIWKESSAIVVLTEPANTATEVTERWFRFVNITKNEDCTGFVVSDNATVGWGIAPVL